MLALSVTASDSSGDKLTDHSGNNHHGKIHGATWVKADGSPINVGSSNRPNR